MSLLAFESCKSLEVDQAVRSRHVDKESLNGGVACSLTTQKDHIMNEKKKHNENRGKGSTKETRPCGGPEAKPCILSPHGLDSA